MESFRQSAHKLGVPLNILACDMNPQLSSACLLNTQKYFKSPHCLSEEYPSFLLKLCEEEGVDALIPTIDTELEILARLKETLLKVGTHAIISSPEVVSICRDKLKTAAFLEEINLPTPRTLPYSKNIDVSEWSFPLILKPIGGSSSKGIARVESLEELKHFPAPKEPYMIQECWQGKEYTVNLYFNKEGQLGCAIPHLRIETRGGEVSKGITQRIPSLEAAAKTLGKYLPGGFGPLCFQAIVKPSGEFCIFEINARFGGGYPLAHQAGATFAQWILEDLIGEPSSVNNNWENELTMLRHDSALFIHHEENICL